MIIRQRSRSFSRKSMLRMTLLKMLISILLLSFKMMCKLRRKWRRRLYAHGKKTHEFLSICRVASRSKKWRVQGYTYSLCAMGFKVIMRTCACLETRLHLLTQTLLFWCLHRTRTRLMETSWKWGKGSIKKWERISIRRVKTYSFRRFRS